MTGWTGITAEAMNEQAANDLADELRAVTNNHNDVQVDGTTVTAYIRGYHNDGESRLMDTTQYWDTAVVIDANNTVESGHGKALRTVSDQHDDVVVLETSDGAVGARAQDVANDLSGYVDAELLVRL
jgi:phage tail sheath gpL-like